MRIVGNVVGLMWLTLGWMVFLWPITLAVGLTSLFLGAMRDSRAPSWMRRRETPRTDGHVSWILLAPSALSVVNLLWGGIFLTPDEHAPAVTPWYAYVTGVVLLIEVGVSFVLFLDRRRPATIAIAALLPQVWIGILTAFLSAWAVTSGGTLGDL